ncbi:MAG: CoA transferase [Alphaproteobacteria bacterium]|nr:CoA transferase [Alphaproteobacteria bacterium]MDP6829708.1 CoA transferase [Alphaproteobacteria bacterium]MDP6874215.1 CoA transferase [Alphaproteobacteria bacterium]
MPTAPMAGIRVVDFTTVIAGPFCTRLLADCGAEVIKIETEAGDQIRLVPPISDGASSYFGHLNCGKKSVVLDLRSDEGHRAIKKLIASADVVVENFRPGVMKRLGLDYADLAVDHADLIYCAISGFGQTGPRAMEPAYAPMIHAGSGLDLAQMEYQDELTQPEKCGVFNADVMASLYAFGAIQTALLGKERHGTGQFIDVALMDSIINLLIYECQMAQFPDLPPRILYGPTRAKDGFVIVTPIGQRIFEDMADAMGHPEWKTDPRFEVAASRREHWGEVVAAMESWTSTRTARECEDVLVAAGVPCSRYRTVGEAMNDPQSQARGLMATVQDGAGGYQVPNPPFKFADGTIGVVPVAPKLGEHNEEVLAGLD